MAQRTTIRDVAALAHVSYQTVSRVINDSSMVSGASRQRVLDAMATLNYVPSAAARSLKDGRTQLLGVLVHDNPNPFFSAVVRGIEDVAYNAGYCAIVCSPRDARREADYLYILRQHRVAGIAVVPMSMQRHPASDLAQSGMPIVSMDSRLPSMDSVLIDNVGAAMEAVDHLIRLGHRRIGFITGPLTTTTAHERLVGYRRAIRRVGLPLDRGLQASCAWDSQAAATTARTMLSSAVRPTALIAASNDLTLGVIAEAARMDLHIPDDVALVGFDELSWNPALMSPVTTVIQPSRHIGIAAAELLLDRINGRYSGSPRRVRLSAHLEIRQSCGSNRAHGVRPLHLLGFIPARFAQTLAR